MNRHFGFVFAGVALALGSNAAAAPVPAKPTIVLQRVGIPDTTRQLGMGLAEFPPHAAKSWHSAAGPELCYVLDGTITLRTRDQPPRTFYAGESFRIPARLVHSTSAGPQGAKVLAVWARTPGEQFNFPITTPRPRSQVHAQRLAESSNPRVAKRKPAMDGASNIHRPARK